jgi:hypothetical protein
MINTSSKTLKASLKHLEDLASRSHGDVTNPRHKDHEEAKIRIDARGVGP